MGHTSINGVSSSYKPILGLFNLLLNTLKWKGPLCSLSLWFIVSLPPLSLPLSLSHCPPLSLALVKQWQHMETIELVNDGTGLGFGIVGGKTTGVIVKTILPGGVADKVTPPPSFPLALTVQLSSL